MKLDIMSFYEEYRKIQRDYMRLVNVTSPAQYGMYLQAKKHKNKKIR